MLRRQRQALKDSLKFFVVGVEFVRHGEVAGADTVANGGELLVELGGGGVLGLGCLAAGEQFLGGPVKQAGSGGYGRPDLRRS